MTTVTHSLLTRLGTESHAGVELWRRAVEAQIERVDDAVQQFAAARNPSPSAYEAREEAASRLQWDGTFLLVAVRQVIRFVDAYHRATGDARLTRARDDFYARAPNAKEFRDYLEHLDAYIEGTGHAQQDGRVAAQIKAGGSINLPSGGAYVLFGDQKVHLQETGGAAIALAETAHDVWQDAWGASFLAGRTAPGGTGGGGSAL